MNRIRAACIVLKDNNILLMDRNNHGEVYHSYIGGGVDDGEAPEVAVVREAYEETSIRVSVRKLLYHAKRTNGDEHYFYLCDYIDGQPEIQKGTNEFADNLLGQNLYTPKWVPIAELPNLTIYPNVISSRLHKDIEEGLIIENVSIEAD